MPLTVPPIPGEPALFVQNTSATLVIADLHIGIERELYRSGINIPSQTKKIFDRLYLIANHSHDRIVLLGDVKHNVPYTSAQEQRELPIFLSRISRDLPVDTSGSSMISDAGAQNPHGSGPGFAWMILHSGIVIATMISTLWIRPS